MITKYLWLFLYGGKAKHALRADQLAAFPHQAAVCGRGVLPWLPATAGWRDDATALAALPRCKACINTLKLTGEYESAGAE